MLFRSCSFETSEIPINSSIFYEANIRHKHAKQQTRTKNNTLNKKALKEDRGFGSRIARNARNKTIEVFGLYHTKTMC
jgi:hypothetical protein